MPMRLRGAAFWFVVFVALLAYVLWRERGEVVQGKIVLNLNPDDIVKIEVQRQQIPSASSWNGRAKIGG
jgi:hypothetical protein